MNSALKKSVKYIGYFDFQDSTIERNYVLSAANKMEYIAQALCNAGYQVEIISHSAVIEPNLKFFRPERKQRGPNFSVKYFSSFGGTSLVIQLLRKFWHTLTLFFYLVFYTHKDESIIVYHSLGYYNVILLAKRIRKFRMILELEEIYQDVIQCNSLSRKWEYDMINAADGYILSTELLNLKVNPLNKPSIVIYGTYLVTKPIVDKFNDGKIHVVYAGTLDPRKGSVAAVEAAKYLSADYHIHILGSGSKAETDQMIQLITMMSEQSEASITFHGLLKGKAYSQFVQGCHIGLCTQDPDAQYNDTSFPSKILSYMSNGLRVVSIDIKTIRNSSIGQYMTYYRNQTPQEVAQAILNVDFANKYDSRAILCDLDSEFVCNIKKII